MVTMDPRVDYYRRQAARCEEWAEGASNPEIKAEYKRLAIAWLTLANLHHQRKVSIASKEADPVPRRPK